MQRLASLFPRARAAFPAFAFFGGFAWDAGTLGRTIQSLDLSILLGYLIVAGGILVWMGRRGAMRGVRPGDRAGPTIAATLPAPDIAGPGGTPELAISAANGASARVSRGFTPARIRARMRNDGPAFALQFLFGSLFSALVIFYFLSSSYLPGFLLVLALAALLVLNEFLESHYHRFTLTWTLYGLCAILLFNFALPHLVHSIHPIWFFLSTAAGVWLVHGIKALSPKAQGSLWPLQATAGVLVLLFLVNAIPPVPLVKKNLVICRNLEHVGGRYLGEMQKPPFYSFWRASESVVRQRNGEKVYCFTSVFLPTGIQCTLYHRWRYRDPRKGEWAETSRIGFPITGGRKEGFRGYTYKRNLAPGRWEVRVETESGRVLGTIHFRAAASTDTTMEFKKLILE